MKSTVLALSFLLLGFGSSMAAYSVGTHPMTGEEEEEPGGSATCVWFTNACFFDCSIQNNRGYIKSVGWNKDKCVGVGCPTQTCIQAVYADAGCQNHLQNEHVSLKYCP